MRPDFKLLEQVLEFAYDSWLKNGNDQIFSAVIMPWGLSMPHKRITNDDLEPGNVRLRRAEYHLKWDVDESYHRTCSMTTTTKLRACDRDTYITDETETSPQRFAPHVAKLVERLMAVVPPGADLLEPVEMFFKREAYTCKAILWVTFRTPEVQQDEVAPTAFADSKSRD